LTKLGDSGVAAGPSRCAIIHDVISSRKPRKIALPA